MIFGKWRIRAACVLWAAVPLPVLAALSGSESAMVRSIDAEHARTIGLLERLVNVNSGSRNLPGVRKVGEMMRAELAPLGFQLRWIPMEKAGRAGHIVATHQGNGRGKRMLLIGHLDTVFEPDSPFQRWALKGMDDQGR